MSVPYAKKEHYLYRPLLDRKAYGRLAATLRGAAVDDPNFADWGLWPGTLWSEAEQGTNGIGTCLAEGRALTIHRDQHFHTRNTALSCTSTSAQSSPRSTIFRTASRWPWARLSRFSTALVWAWEWWWPWLCS